MATKFKQIQWTIENAAAEFGCDKQTLSKYFRQGGIEPKFKSGKFSTDQITVAMFGDFDAQKVRKITHEANLLEMEEKQSRGELVAKSNMVEIVQRGLQAMVSTVLAMTEITIEQREKIIEQLRECGERVARGDKDS
jgi:hypothetical protein